MAQDLIAFTQGLVLDGDIATAEPKRLRYVLLHAAGRITTTGRTVTLHIQSEWPWARQLADAFDPAACVVLRHLTHVHSIDEKPMGYPPCASSRPRVTTPRHFRPRQAATVPVLEPPIGSTAIHRVSELDRMEDPNSWWLNETGGLGIDDG